jgi:hypothetical protein
LVAEVGRVFHHIEVALSLKLLLFMIPYDTDYNIATTNEKHENKY